MSLCGGGGGQTGNLFTNHSGETLLWCPRQSPSHRTFYHLHIMTTWPSFTIKFLTHFFASKKRLRSFFLTNIMPGWPISFKKLLRLYCFPYLWTTFYLCTTFSLETTLGRTYRVDITTLYFIAIFDFISLSNS